MQTKTFDLDPTYQCLERIRSAFVAGQKLIPITSWMKLTKTQKARCEVLLLNDRDLQSDVESWIASRSSVGALLKRYQALDPQFQLTELPEHFAARIMNGVGAICSGQNIFLFFPDCLGLLGRQEQDYFGIELIDVWANIFHRSVFPCVRQVFTQDVQVQLLSSIGGSLDKAIYLAALFHEVGHRVGSWRVAPQPDPRLKVSSYYLDVFGEIYTDSLLVSNLQEFPEVRDFVVLQRLFWFGRRGFRENPQSALINTDNDSWLSCLLWNRLQRAGVLKQRGSQRHLEWHLEIPQVVQVFSEMAQDVEILGQQVLQLPTQAQQDHLCREWMQREVPSASEHHFTLPLDLRNVYLQCLPIEEIPHFIPLTQNLPMESV